MKYFSLSFRPEKRDYNDYYKDFGKLFLINQLKRSIASFVLFGVLCFMLSSSGSGIYVLPFFFIFVATSFMPLIYSRKLSVFFLQSKQMQRESRYDFYADHIEIHIEPDATSQQKSEKHFKLSGFTAVTESRTNFYFSYMNEKMMIIPKRVLTQENYEMIENLIQNYFSGVYNKV